MSIEVRHPAPPVVLTVVLCPGQPAGAADDRPAIGEASAAPPPARPVAPEEEPTWEDAAWS